MNTSRIYVLGGYQSDFSRNVTRDGQGISELFVETVQAGLNETKINPSDIGVGHVGNFVAPLFTGQSHLGGFFGHVDNAMRNLPASSHEAACASGSMALLSAMANLESGRYDMACVLGIEVMRNMDGESAANNLSAAAWVDKEWQDSRYLWPTAFHDVLCLYEQRYGLDKKHLTAISKKNFHNAKTNPNAQTRAWTLGEENFGANDELNPIVNGRIRRYDCGQITDGAAVVFLATQERALAYAKSHGIPFNKIPYIKGWGHINAPILFTKKLEESHEKEYLFPHVNELFKQTLQRANFKDINDIDGLEVHDCFNISEYMALDHCGLHAPGNAWKSIEAGDTNSTGKLPINMSGGLIGCGHPVGATGVRMALDCYKQLTTQADGYQLENPKNMMTFNLGGSMTTCASLIIGL